MKDGLSLSQRPTLVTERLSLRRPCDDDVDAIVSIVGDWEVASRLARVPILTARQTLTFSLNKLSRLHGSGRSLCMAPTIWWVWSDCTRSTELMWLNWDTGSRRATGV